MITRFVLTALRGLVAAAALLLLVLLLGWVGLQWLVMPRLDSYRPQLAAWMSQALDAQVAVQQLTVEASWWHPVVVARDLEITATNGEPGLRVARARLRLSPLAWLHGSAGALEVRAPEVWVRRDAAGDLSIAGVARAEDARGAAWARRLLLLRPGVDVLGARLHWRDALLGGELTLEDVDLRMRGRRGQLRGQVTAAGLVARLAPDLPALQLSALAGNVRWQHLERRGGRDRLRLDDLTLVMGDGRRLDGAGLVLDYPVAASAAPVRLQVSAADLPVLARLAQRLPRPDGVQRALRDLQVDGGRMEALDAQWQGFLRAPRAWRVRGEVADLALAAAPVAAGEDAGAHRPGRPGVSGLGLVFEADDAGGRATLALDAGSLSFPGVFEDPDIAVQRLRAEAQWQVDSGGIRVEVPHLELSNADAEGQFSGSWRSGDARPGGVPRFPGFIDLAGQLTRGDGARVHRYLPLVLPADARHYVRDAIEQGRLRDVDVRVRGLLDEVPFNLPGEDGIFSIAGQVDDGIMAYVPPRLQDAGEPAWPVLTELGGRLEFEGAAMRVRQASAQVREHAGWGFAAIDADIADFDEARVTVNASGSGELASALGIVRSSPLAALTGHVLDGARASGSAGLQLALDLPVDDPSHATVRGTVQLEQNTVTLRAGVPPLEAAHGTVAFTDTGFAIDDVRARLLGKPVVLGGGLDRGGPQGAEGPAHIRLQGQASAAGLQELAGRYGLGSWAAWTGALHGDAAYDLSLELAADGVQGVALDSSLQGLALALPPPLEKAAAERWPLHLRWQRQGAADGTPAGQLELRLADRLALLWALPPGADTAPRGTMAWGAAARRPLPPAGSGFALVAELDALDVDRWMPFIHPPEPAADPLDAAGRWLPDLWRVTLGHLRVAGRELVDVAAHGQRRGARWQGEVESPALAGRVEYQGGGPGQAGHLVARLSRLRVQPAVAAAPQPEPQPEPEPSRDLPSVDLRADHFAWNDLDLGQLDLHASQAGPAGTRAWRMDRLQLTTPEARLQASGSRTPGPAPEHGGPGRTRLDFELALDDAGALLDRLGQQGVMAGGSGTVTGELAWPGSPLDFSVAGLAGDLRLDLASGRFLKMEPGAGRLFGILSLQALPRRLMLDFNDVFRSGWAFDRAQAQARLARGVLSTDDLRIQGVGAAVSIRGQTDLPEQTLDLNLRVEPRIDAGAAALAATAVNPALGAAAFVAQLALRKPIGRAAARTFRVRGSWDDPEVDPMAPVPVSPKKDSPEEDEAENRMPAAGENNP